jgi:hypothetical protein
MVSGECKKIVDAAAKAGLARESLSRALSTPHVAEHIRDFVTSYTCPDRQITLRLV